MNPKKILTGKNITYGIIATLVVIGGYFLFFNKKDTQQTLTVHPADFLQQVSASGTIVARQNLDLSFAGTDQITGIYVKVGDQVSVGQLLVGQNTLQLNAQKSQMEAGVDLAEAKLQQLLAGTSPEDIKTKEDSVAFARQNLDNAYASSLTFLGGGYTAIYNAYTTVSYIQTNYFSGLDQQSFKVQEARKNIAASVADAKKYLDSANSGLSQDVINTALLHMAQNLNTTYNNLITVRQQCEEDVYYTRVVATDKTSLDTQKTNVNTALTNLISSQSSIASYVIALQKTQDELQSAKAPARQIDIAVYRAQVKQADASLQDVLAQINKKIIYSPITGIVTLVNAKVGSIFSSQNVAVSVMSSNDFEIESYVPQINISLLGIGQDAQVTLDAYEDMVFLAKVASIDPAQTIKDGVSTYKVVFDFTDARDQRIKSGMTGNVVVTTLKKSNVISIPQAIVVKVNGQKTVKVKQGDATIEKSVETGSVASNGNIEITSGLKEGEMVVLK